MTKPSNQKPNTVSIQGDGNVIGNQNTVSIRKTGSTPTEFAQAFAQIYELVRVLPDPVVREEAKELVQKIEAESTKGKDADPSHIERWLRFLADMAPDIRDVVISSLRNPVLGVSTVIEKIIAKANK